MVYVCVIKTPENNPSSVLHTEAFDSMSPLQAKDVAIRLACYFFLVLCNRDVGHPPMKCFSPSLYRGYRGGVSGQP